VWHASVSLQSAGTFLRSSGRLRRIATTLLAPVGGDTEWWHWNPRACVGHLRVNVTTTEAQSIPPGLATSDAGETGPSERRRR
jgi:hypothetical protein